MIISFHKQKSSPILSVPGHLTGSAIIHAIYVLLEL